MSTRSAIGYLENGSITAIYCHSDGYPEWNGEILLQHYNFPEKIKQLVALGDISSLGPKLAPEHGQPHSFDSPADGVTIAYHRDRGEQYCPPATGLSLKRVWSEFGASYIYIYEIDGEQPGWYFYRSKNGPKQILSEYFQK